MRSPLWLAIVSMMGCAAALMPVTSEAADVRASAGIPRVSFTAAGPALMQDLWLGIDTSVFAVDVTAPRCARADKDIGLPQAQAEVGSCNGNAAIAHLAERPEASVTLKLPEWYQGAPLIDLTLVSWRDARRDEGSATTVRGAAFEAEMMQTFGRHEWTAGYSQPLGGAAGIAQWQAAWVSVATRFAGGTVVRLKLEGARETQTNARDVQYTLQVAHFLGRAIRVNAFLTHAPDDGERRWRAGVGLDWPF